MYSFRSTIAIGGLALLLLTSCSETAPETGDRVYSFENAGNGSAVVNTGAVLTEEDISSMGMISEDVAKQVALRRANVSESQVQGYVNDIYETNGILEYHINFWVGTIQHFYVIHGSDGSVASFSTVFHETGYVAPLLPESEEDLDNTEDFVASAGNLTLEEVKAIATSDAGIFVSDIYNIQITEGYNGSIPQYKLNFTTADANYEYYIAANTGMIFSSRKEAVEREDDFLTLPDLPEVDTTLPDVGIPMTPTEPEEPETTLPETTEPEVPTVPDTTVIPTIPETTVPETTVPELTAPELTAPPIYGE